MELSTAIKDLKEAKMVLTSMSSFKSFISGPYRRHLGE